MNIRYEFLLSSRSTCSWRCFALGLALLLVSLLAFSGCGGGGDDGSAGSSGGAVTRESESVPVGDDGNGSGDGGVTPEEESVPVVAGCEGDIFMQAPVEAIDAHMQTLTLLGLTLYVDGHTQFNNANLEDLAVDDYVDVRGFSDVDDSIAASCLEREEVPRDEVELRGPVDPNGIAESRLFILGVEVQFSANTVFEDGSLTQAEFFAQLQPGDLVAVKGQLGSIHAEEVRFDDSIDDLGDDGVDQSSRDFDDHDDDGDDFGLASDLDDDDDGIPDDDDNGIDDDDNPPIQSPAQPPQPDDDGVLDDDDDGVLDDDDDGILDDDDDGIDDDDNPPIQSPAQPPQPVQPPQSPVDNDDDDDGDSDDDDDDDDGDNDNDDDDDD